MTSALLYFMLAWAWFALVVLCCSPADLSTTDYFFRKRSNGTVPLIYILAGGIFWLFLCEHFSL